MTIRLATREDVPQLKALDAASAEVDSFGDRKFYVLNAPGLIDYFLDCAGLTVADDDGAVVGYMLTHPVDWMHGAEKLIWIEHVGVHPAHRRKGVGSALLAFAEQHYKGQAGSLYAEIHPLNAASLAMFRSSGAELGERAQAFIDL